MQMENIPINFLSVLQLALISIPVILLFIVNVFYAFCLIFPRRKRRLKQPLSVLLGFLLWCSLSYCISLFVLMVMLNSAEYIIHIFLPYMIVLYFVDHSMTCYVWLSVFYYIQIVPLQHVFLMWVKRNVKSVIYMFLGLDTAVFFLSRVDIILRAHTVANVVGNSINGTTKVSSFLPVSRGISFFIIKIYILICLCIMLPSSFCTICYLRRHMRSAAQSGSNFSKTRLRSQMRVTITGICQGVFYIIYGVFYFFVAFNNMDGSFVVSWISFSTTTLYIVGTTATLGVGQSVFREWVACLWKALKALKPVDSNQKT